MGSSSKTTTTATLGHPPPNHAWGWVTHEELSSLRHRGPWLLVAWALAATAFFCAPLVLRAVWPSLLSTLGDSFALALVCTYVPNLGQHLVWNAVMWPIYLSKHALFEAYRINPKPWPWESSSAAHRAAWWGLVRQSIWRVLAVNNGIVGVPALALIYIPLHAHGWFPVALEAFPSYGVLALQLVAAMVIEDACFYCSHRLLHTPALYARVHKIHHAYTHNVVLAAENAHPIEFLLGNLNPVVLPGVLLNMHLSTFALWVGLRIFVSVGEGEGGDWEQRGPPLWEQLGPFATGGARSCESSSPPSISPASPPTSDEHCGYAFPWSPCRLLPFQASAEAHDFHHAANTGVFASQFTYLDRFFGTDVPFLHFREEKERALEAAAAVAAAAAAAGAQPAWYLDAMAADAVKSSKSHSTGHTAPPSSGEDSYGSEGGDDDDTSDSLAALLPDAVNNAEKLKAGGGGRAARRRGIQQQNKRGSGGGGEALPAAGKKSKTGK